MRIFEVFETWAVTRRTRSNEFEAIRFAAAVRATLDPLNLGQRFALLSQDLFILSRSIAENICFVRPETSLDAGRQVATEATADCFTAHRHEKNTAHGWQARSDLSVGQRQRLAITRNRRTQRR